MSPHPKPNPKVTVKEVTGKKSYNNHTYYKLKFGNREDSSWVRSDKCNCPELIKQYERSLKQRHKDESEDEWEVEEILDRRVVNDQVEYLLKWKGWSGSPTWAPEEDCKCINLIAAYENPKLKKLWDFRGSNTKLWLNFNQMIKYMENFIELNASQANLLKFKANAPEKERKLDLVEGINIGPLCYENHWYLVIILVNHICVTRRIIICDALNTLIGTPWSSHPVVKRLSKVYRNFPIRPIKITPQDRSDVCAFYILAAFERALFLLDSRAESIVGSIHFQVSRAERIRSQVLPESNGEISVGLPNSEVCTFEPQCEFCEKTYRTMARVDSHIRRKHIKPNRPSSSSC